MGGGLPCITDHWHIQQNIITATGFSINTHFDPKSTDDAAEKSMPRSCERTHNYLKCNKAKGSPVVSIHYHTLIWDLLLSISSPSSMWLTREIHNYDSWGFLIWLFCPHAADTQVHKPNFNWTDNTQKKTAKVRILLLEAVMYGFWLPHTWMCCCDSHMSTHPFTDYNWQTLWGSPRGGLGQGMPDNVVQLKKVLVLCVLI